MKFIPCNEVTAVARANEMCLFVCEANLCYYLVFEPSSSAELNKTDNVPGHLLGCGARMGNQEGSYCRPTAQPGSNLDFTIEGEQS